MKIPNPFYTALGILLCSFLMLSQARGWLPFASVGSKHAAMRAPSSLWNLSHK